jgi:hypothetical protein
MKGAFTLALGLGAGLLIGAYVIKRLDDAQRAVAPVNLAGQAGRAAGTLIERYREASADGRIAAAEREAELRSRFEVPSVRRALGG